MQTQQEQALERLREEIESLVGRKMKTPKDFDFLAEQIFEKIHETVSPTTLKRIWGYLAKTKNPIYRVDEGQESGSGPYNKSTDIEERICELFQSEIGQGARVVSLSLVEKVVSQLGMPDGSSEPDSAAICNAISRAISCSSGTSSSSLYA